MEDRAIVALYALDRYDAMHAEKRGRRPASCCSSLCVLMVISVLVCAAKGVAAPTTGV